MNPAQLFQKLFFVFPEIALDDQILEFAMSNKWISEEDWADFRRAQRLGKRFVRVSRRLDEKSILQRIMLVAPEIMSRDTVDMLRSLNLISIPTAHAMRAGFSAVNGLRATFVSDRDIASRMFRLLDDVNSEDWISFLRSLDEERIAQIRAAFLRTRLGPDWRSIPGVRLNKLEAMFVQDKILESIRRAEMLRAMVLAGKATNSAVRSALKVQSVWDVMTIFAHTIFGPEFLRAAVKTGVIDPDKYNTIRALEKMGLNIWRKGTAAADYNNTYARWMMISEGIISPETIAALKELGWINSDQARWMNFGAKTIRGITRGQLENMGPKRRYRVTPGETPLQTYARVSKVSDGHLLRLLNEAAKESRAAAEKAMRRALVGGKTRAAQQTLVAREMHKEMRSLAENLGPLIIFAEREVAGAAVESMSFLQRGILNRLSEEDQLSLRLSARSGLDSMVSRAENRARLSRLVYRNMSAWNGQMDREINLSILRGLSAKEFADRVARMIRPDVRGGVSYAAMRLARTEINNAFHFTQIRYTREMPWVEGYQWHLSGSHGQPDICNQMAGDDHDNLGPGVYKKANVPGKPHPHCLCYVTAVTKKPGEFERSLLRGSYKKYFDTMRKGSLFEDEYAETASSVANQVFNQFGPVLKKQTRDVATTLGASLVVSALRNPAAAAAFVSNATRGFTDLAERMQGARGLTVRRSATKSWLGREVGAAEAEDLLPGLPAGRDIGEASRYNLARYGTVAEAPRDFAALVRRANRDELIEIAETLGITVNRQAIPKSASEWLPTEVVMTKQLALPLRVDPKNMTLEELHDSLVKYLEKNSWAQGLFEHHFRNTSSIQSSANVWLGNLFNPLFTDTTRSGLQAFTAHEAYAGLFTYRTINALLRENAGDLNRFASALDDLLSKEDVAGELRRFFVMATNPDSTRKEIADARRDLYKKMHVEADELKQRDTWHRSFGYAVVSGMSDRGNLVGQEWLSSGLSLGQWYSQGIQRMTRTQKTSENLYGYRVSTHEFMGASSPEDVVDLVGSVFRESGVTSVEMAPTYFTQTTEWYGTVRYRIYLPEGTEFGVGNPDENEIMLAPGTRYAVLRALLSVQKNENGDNFWEVDLIALPPE